jgi:3-oxoacyl-[acyl-carrier-protein] synthase III
MQKNNKLIPVEILSCAGYLPKNILTNDDLAAKISTSNEWIFSRTGIKQRHIADQDEQASDMAVSAAKAAINKINLSTEDIDLIIVATTTPDKIFPSTASIVQGKLGIKQCISFDVQAVCSGFIHILNIASSMITLGQAKKALIIGSEKMSSILDWSDRSTCVLFGDGAGAMILGASTNDNSYIIDSELHCDGSLSNILYAEKSNMEDSGCIKMNGKEVYRHAVEKMASSMVNILEKNNITLEDIKFIVPHQANVRIIEAIANKLKAKPEQVVITMENTANTSAASIPLALTQLAEKNMLNKGDLILASALGGGITWGSCLIKW